MQFGITLNNNPYSYEQKLASIDKTSIKEVAQEIFTRAENKPSTQNNIDFSKFNRTDIGLNLYNGSVSPDVSKAVSLQNSGQGLNLNQETIANIQYLNTQAAKAVSETPAKNMDGKIHVQNESSIDNSERANAPLPDSTTFFNTSNLGKDKEGGGNPFFAFTNNDNNGGNTTSETTSSF